MKSLFNVATFIIICILILYILVFLLYAYHWIRCKFTEYRRKQEKMRHSLKQKLCTGNYIADKKYIGDSRYIIIYKKNDFFSFLRLWKEYKNGEYSDFTRKYANQFIKKINK